MVSIFGLLGLEGTIVDNELDFLKLFTELIKNPSIGMIIIALRLSDNMIEYLLDFKQNNRIPFVFILPDVYQPNIEKEGIIFNKIIDAIGHIFSL